ncbi:deoxyguanosinetriphosphate triphosphohydrolase [soil metagenome]
MQTARAQYEELMENWLAPAAARSRCATRQRDEEPSPVRNAFQRDRDRIVHCRAFRRLKSKTQVFLPPSGDHVRTRLTHTLEVTQIARTIARALHLNEDLTEAIGLAHDLGHTPFGHAGEQALSTVYSGFQHNEQSLRVVDVLEKDGIGLNLTDDTRDGILRHSKPESHISGEVTGRPATAEGQVVKISDGISCISHDLEDARAAAMLDDRPLPPEVEQILGDRHSKRIDTLVQSVIDHSRPLVQHPVDGREVIVMGADVLQAADALRGYLFTEVYDPINRLPATRHAQEIVVRLFEYYSEHPEEIADSALPSEHDQSPERRAADFVSGMTDDFARRRHDDLFVPRFQEL